MSPAGLRSLTERTQNPNRSPYPWSSSINSTRTSPSNRLAASAKVSEDRDDEMRDKPDVIDTEILVDVDQDQDARHKDPEQDVGELRERIRRVGRRKKKEVNKENETREKQ